MSKAEYIRELVESVGSAGIPREVRQQVQQQVHMERAKFRHADTGPSLSHALKVIRELDGVRGYRPDQNMTQRPTVGMDGEYDKYDPNPEARWDPGFRKQLEASKEKSKAGKLLKKKDGTLVDPQTGAPIDPETGEPVAQEDPEEQQQGGQQQDPNADPNQVQQDPAQAQQAGDPQAQQDLDPNAGQPPQKAELPGDQRKDPTWKGQIPAAKSDDQPDASQRVVSRYDTDKDPLRKRVKPTTGYERRKAIRQPQSNAKTGNHGPVQKYWG